MSRHPATPMNEADLRVHLSEQTRIPVQLVDVLTLDRDQETRDELVAGADGSRILLFDTLTNDHQQKIGRIIWKMAKEDNGPLFVAGSSGVEYALTSHWIADNVVSGQPDCLRPTSGVDRILVVSGSCSPVTQRQIQWAVENGFVEIGLRTEAFGDDHRLEAELAGIVEKSAALLGDGRSVIVHTSRGPDDPRIAATKPLLGNARASAGKLGNALGRILESAIERHPLNRVAVTGGDTSGHVARSLGIDALEMLAPLAPGSPLCEARSSKERIDGLEITFKGGQVGHDDFFATVLAGKR